MKDLRIKLYKSCHAYLEERINAAKKAIAAAQSSANDETKSSMGDKYETGRAMMQLEIEKNTTQLAEAENQLNILKRIDPEKITDTIQNGSVIISSQGNFYLAVSAGQIKIDAQNFICISSSSPLGKVLIGKKKGEKYDLNGKQYFIENVF